MEWVLLVLWVLLGTVLAVIGLAVALLLALLVAPLRFQAAGVVQGLRPQEGEIGLSALWGAVAVRGAKGARRGWQVRLLGRPVRRRRKPPAPEAPAAEPVSEAAAATEEAPAAEESAAEAAPEEPTKEAKRPKRDVPFAQELWRRGLVSPWIGPAARALRELLAAPRCERLRGTLCVGTGDPAATGMLCGALWSVAGPLSAFPAVALQVQPDFLDPRADAEGEVALSLRPGSVLLVALRLVRRGPAWRTIKAYRAAKRRGASVSQPTKDATQERVSDRD